MAFTEQRFPVEISQGSSFGPAWKTVINAVVSGFEERAIKWEQQRCEGVVVMENADPDQFDEMLTWIYAMRGAGHGFRFKDFSDYKSCIFNGTHAFSDQVIGTGDGSTAAFQLIKNYTKGLTYSRDIKKPVSGTVLVGIGGVECTTNFSVDTTTGIITFDNITGTVTNAVDQGSGITRITVTGHGLFTGDTAYLSTFTGDWAGLNAARYVITLVDGNNFDISFDSSGFTAYSGNAGQFTTLPQSGETVTAGYEFDVPVRFDTDRMDAAYVNFEALSFTLPIVEIKL